MFGDCNFVYEDFNAKVSNIVSVYPGAVILMVLAGSLASKATIESRVDP